ncbi:MAG: hypothetical protein KDE51_10070, partial [Anaerolineales bacterium]|nr:hypothetical protein [Anaerolineales bacterium]
MKKQIIWSWSKNRKIAFIFFGGTIIVVFLIPILGYINSWKWVGMVTYQYDSSLNPIGVEGIKTFWDWLNLLIIPFVLALAGVWFTHVQSETELEIAA